MVRQLKRSPGYKGHRVWYRFPFTLGTIAFFADKDALLSFARSPEHAAIMRWMMEPGNAKGGFIRIYEMLPHGYTSGVWRSDPPGAMQTIDRFIPLTGEEDRPSSGIACRPSIRHPPATTEGTIFTRGSERRLPAFGVMRIEGLVTLIALCG
jgi:hypothetical protein